MIGDYLVAYPNGGFRNGREAVSLRAQGVQAGIPDLLLAYPVNRCHGLWIELKNRNGGILSDNQRKWISRLSGVHYRAIVCLGWDNAKDAILDYLDGGK